MPIEYNKQNKTFHLYNADISYIITILRNGQPGQLYYGRRIPLKQDYSELLELSYRPMAAYRFEGDKSFSLEHIRQEYPACGQSDLHYPAFEIERDNGSTVTEFLYESHSIFSGKPSLEGLPAVYVESDDEAQTLEIVLLDKVLGTRIRLLYTIWNDLPVIIRSARFEQLSGNVKLHSAMSCCADLPDMDYNMLELTGAWSRERHMRVCSLEYGVQSIHSMRGCSSSNYNPFTALMRKNSDEDSGEVFGFSLVYSGNFLCRVECDTYDMTRVCVGINPQGFTWSLDEGGSFQTPEVVMVYSHDGLGAMSRTYHRLYRSRLARGVWRDRRRPVLFNSWEAAYFDIDSQKILEFARSIKPLGAELLVLDDGWFGKRNDDYGGLGDWFVNRDKLPEGIGWLAERVNEEGLLFGIWIEPEMVNKDSDLYQKHPDWVMCDPERPMSHGRNQYILDFSKPAVIDCLYGQLHKLLEEAPIAYVKWDMNRCFSECFSQGSSSRLQGELAHRYILGLYSLYERLERAFPEVLFESCASGGARFDPGMLYYSPQIWTSDNTDAVERVKIQYGTSVVYPLSCMCAHVSSVPNHQVKRITPLETRGNVALFGVFGYELDPRGLTLLEREEISRQIAMYKKYGSLLTNGMFYRLQSPFTDNIAAWMVISEDKSTAILGWYRTLNETNIGYRRLRLRALDENAEYRLSDRDYRYSGAELMYAGLQIDSQCSGENALPHSDKNCDFSSCVVVLTKVIVMEHDRCQKTG